MRCPFNGERCDVSCAARDFSSPDPRCLIVSGFSALDKLAGMVEVVVDEEEEESDGC